MERGVERVVEIEKGREREKERERGRGRGRGERERESREVEMRAMSTWWGWNGERVGQEDRTGARRQGNKP